MNLMDIATTIVMNEMPGSEEGPETVELVGWGSFDDLADRIRADVFGVLVQKAMPIIENYHSDLYRDAQWLQQNLAKDGLMQFTYGVRKNGTHLNGGHHDASAIWGRGEIKAQWHMVLSQDRGYWSLLIVPVPLFR